jgi:hypothetical protein
MKSSTAPNTQTGLTIEYKVHFKSGRGRCRKVGNGGSSNLNSDQSSKIPRISRLMALAIRFEHLIQQGDIQDMAELARLGHVSRARVTQIMNLLHLAPDIQEAILFLPAVFKGKDPITERHLRRVISEVDWETQRHIWKKMANIAQTELD